MTTRPRCGSSCVADDDVSESVTVLVSCVDGACTIKGTSSDDRQSISLSCSLVGCACKSGGGNLTFTRSGFVGEGVGVVLGEGGSCSRREEYTGEKR